jgi:seryl-tRNA synthetase
VYWCEVKKVVQEKGSCYTSRRKDLCNSIMLFSTLEMPLMQIPSNHFLNEEGIIPILFSKWSKPFRKSRMVNADIAAV